MQPFFIATALKWYKRHDVQRAIADACQDREVAPRYGEGFGKRPDEIIYPGDVLAMARKKATSFHCSEERWRRVSDVQTGASRKAQDELRTGWDLVLDIDCPYWYFAKLTTHLFIRALAAHGLSAISVKFSGGKGFHIGVPFEAFPAEITDQETKNLFPEAPRAIARYLLTYIADPVHGLVVVKNNQIIFDGRYKISFGKLQEVTGKSSDAFLMRACKRCGAKQDETDGRALDLCGSCGHHVRGEFGDFAKCERCGGVMEPQEQTTACASCGSTDFATRFDVGALIEVDTVLIASRHLFRTPYSLHEKTGLVSVVIPVSQVMRFEKEEAAPDRVMEFPPFLARDVYPEGAALLAKALHEGVERKEERTFDLPVEAIEEERFPPCMQLILEGLEDGKKRAMFALTNFLKSCGWGPNEIEDRIKRWNEQNPEPLREVQMKSHLRSSKQRKEVFPPPNCKSFYQDIGVCKPDNFCRRIRNPAQYARLKTELAPRRRKLTPEQLAARRAHRQRRKEAAGGPAQEGAS